MRQKLSVLSAVYMTIRRPFALVAVNWIGEDLFRQPKS